MRQQSRREALGNFGNGFLKIILFGFVAYVILTVLGGGGDANTTSNNNVTVKRQNDENLTEIQPLNKTYESLNYTDIARDKDGLAGEHIKLNGKVIQVASSGERTVIARIAEVDNLDNIFYVKIPSEILDYNLLEDDFVYLEGTLYGIETYRGGLGSQVAIPGIEADLVDLQN